MADTPDSDNSIGQHTPVCFAKGCVCVSFCLAGAAGDKLHASHGSHEHAGSSGRECRIETPKS